MTTYTLAVIPGDGIGVDVTDAAMTVVSAAARRHGFAVAPQRFDWSCAHYLATGTMMPADGIETLRGFDAIYLGAVGWPDTVPDSVSLHGLLLPIRKASTNMPTSAPTACCQASRDRCARRRSTSCASARIPRASIPGRAVGCIRAG